MPTLRETINRIGKDFSRRMAGVAIPLLTTEINFMGDPQLAERKLRATIEDQDFSWALMEMARNHNEDPLNQLIERLRREGEESATS